MSDHRQYFVIHNTDADYSNVKSVVNLVHHGFFTSANGIKLGRSHQLYGKKVTYKAHAYILDNPGI